MIMDNISQNNNNLDNILFNDDININIGGLNLNSNVNNNNSNQNILKTDKECEDLMEKYFIMFNFKNRCNICYNKDNLINCNECVFRYCKNCIKKILSMDKKCASCRNPFNLNNLVHSQKNNIFLKKIEKTKKTSNKSICSFHENGYSYFICYNDYKHNTYNLVSCKHNIKHLIIIDSNIFDDEEKKSIIQKINNHISNFLKKNKSSNTNHTNLEKLWNDLHNKLHIFQYKYQYIIGNDTFKKNTIKTFINNF